MHIRQIFAVVTLTASALAQPTPVITGMEVPALRSFDDAVVRLIAKYNWPGAAIAVTRNGQLVLARGYGFQDREGQVPVQPNSLFRVASVSKTITGVATMKLVEQGRLNLDDKLVTLLPDLRTPSNTPPADPRFANITVRNLLEHSGGWDGAVSTDPVFRARAAALALGVPSPPDANGYARFIAGLTLDYTPGSKYVYANSNYVYLGRIIEKITGVSFETHVRDQVFAPMGIERMRIARTLASQRAEGEVKYYDYANAPPSPSIFASVMGDLPRPYGGTFNIEALDSLGGWLASAVDLVRYVNSIDGRRGAAFLSPATVALLTARPALTPASAPSYYAKGFNVRPIGNDANWFHFGSLPGTHSFLIRYANGGAIALIVNTRANTANNEDGAEETDMAGFLSDAYTTVASWPTHDLFGNFSLAGAPSLAASDPVVHGATFQQGIVAGSWVTIKGTALADTQRTWTGADIANGQLPVALDNVRVAINGKPAFVYYISPTQINVQAPEDMTTGPVWVQVTRNGKPSEPVRASLSANAPGFFMYNAAGKDWAVAVHPDGAVVGSISGTRAVRAGDRIQLYGTGFERFLAGFVLNTVTPLSELPVIRIGERNAVVEFAGWISPGLVQVNIVIPQLDPGDHAITATIQGATSPTGLFVPLQ